MKTGFSLQGFSLHPHVLVLAWVKMARVADPLGCSVVLGLPTKPPNGSNDKLTC
jgi:hypothetical protein